jgi:hypothetical protein
VRAINKTVVPSDLAMPFPLRAGYGTKMKRVAFRETNSLVLNFANKAKPIGKH